MVKISQKGLEEFAQLAREYADPSKPGTAFGVMDKDGQMLYSASAGPQDIGTGELMAKDQVFWIASCTKIVTAIACMQLNEKGKLSLHEPAGKHFPGLVNPDLIVSTKPDQIIVGKPKKKITLHHLLTHTAGFAYSWHNKELYNWSLVNEKNEWNCDRLTMPMVHEPGTCFEYSTGVDFVGKIVEVVSGRNLGQYCDENIFGPLGLVDTTFDPKSRPEILKRLCPMYAWNVATGEYTPSQHIRLRAQEVDYSGGGGIFTTVSDFLTILSVLTNCGKGPNGSEILQPGTVEMMWKDQTTTDVGPIEGEVPSSDPKFVGRNMQLGHSRAFGYSMLLNNTPLETGRPAGTGEWGGVANLAWIADPKTGVSYFVANNILPYGDERFVKLVGDVERTLYSNLV